MPPASADPAPQAVEEEAGRSGGWGPQTVSALAVLAVVAGCLVLIQSRSAPPPPPPLKAPVSVSNAAPADPALR